MSFVVCLLVRNGRFFHFGLLMEFLIFNFISFRGLMSIFKKEILFSEQDWGTHL